MDNPNYGYYFKLNLFIECHILTDIFVSSQREQDEVQKDEVQREQRQQEEVGQEKEQAMEIEDVQEVWWAMVTMVF